MGKGGNVFKSVKALIKGNFGSGTDNSNPVPQNSTVFPVFKFGYTQPMTLHNPGQSSTSQGGEGSGVLHDQGQGKGQLVWSAQNVDHGDSSGQVEQTTSKVNNWLVGSMGPGQAGVSSLEKSRWGGEGLEGVRDVVVFGGGTGPLGHPGEFADRGATGIEESPSGGNYGASHPGWFGGPAPLSNEQENHAVLSTFEFGRGGSYTGGSGGAVDSSLSYQTVSVNPNSSRVLNKLVPGPWGGVTRGVPTAPDFPPGEGGGSKTWTIGNPRTHGFQQNTSPGMSVSEETGSSFVLDVESFKKRKLVEC